jgi:shikimate dehydrogenase
MIDAETKVLGVIGDPIAHTLSPAIQNAALEHFRLNARYFAFQVSPPDLRKAVEAVRFLRMPGLNVTLPHKEAIVPLLDKLTPEAQRIGAVNTVVNSGGVLTGANTDAVGFTEAWRRLGGRGWKCALLIGAGGAARAVFTALVQEGFEEIHVACRKPSAGRRMLTALGGENVGRVVPWDRREKVIAELLVNATPFGTEMKDPLPVSARVVRHAKGAIDLVARPRGTRWIALCRSYGIPAEEGSRMLIAQGRESFRLWFGKSPPFPLLERALRSAAGVRGRIQERGQNPS